MALIPMEYAGGGWKTLATANANQTYAAQLATLKNAFNNLTNTDKMLTYLNLGNWCFMQCQNTSDGLFFRLGGGLQDIQTYKLSDTSYKATSLINGAVTDYSTSTNSNALYLVMLEVD